MKSQKNSSSKSLSTGDVIYEEVPGMGFGKKRPCVVLAGINNQAFLLPLSSSSWRVSTNPVINFKGNMSFVILDKAFSKCISKKFVSKCRVSEMAVETCFKSLWSLFPCID